MPADRRLALVTVLLAVLAGACAQPAPAGPPPAPAPDPGATPGRVERALAALPRGWSELPPPPSTPFPDAVSVWTGTSLFLWGEPSSRPDPAGGALFDPLTRRWRATSGTALTPRSRAAGAWTGTEVLMWGGETVLGLFGDGVAYDPALDTWRGLPPAPISARTPVASAWTGRELLVWGSADRSNLDTRDGAAYDPAADGWRPIAAAPFALNQATSAWTGRELLIVGSRLDGNNHARPPGTVGLAYDPAGDRWRMLPPAGLSPQASAVAWTGRELLAWDYELRAAAWDPQDGRWRRLPDLPLDDAECYPRSAAAGWSVFAQFCAGHALWDQRTRRWSRVGHGFDLLATVVAAGPVFLFAGATAGPAGPGPGRLLAYNPG
jgi:hypothetical protein